MRTRVFYNLPESACYGCQACAQICPSGAINMKEDDEGFLFPHIDSDKCIECNLCEKTCPTQLNVIESLFHKTPDYVDAAWEHNIEDRLESTSGGAFFAIALKWLENGGIVYGAGFDDKLNVRHIRISDTEELKRLRGSKYVQSDVSDSFKLVKNDLKQGVKVLYSGTPCQIAGLRSFLKKNYDNLLTIDLVCHGVPSPLIFKEHLKYQERKYNSQLIDYKFRHKKRTGWRSYIKYIFSTKNSKAVNIGNDYYAFCFYNSYINRRSCFQCKFSCSTRIGDITLSDFWHAENKCKKLRKIRKYGFNMVMCNTQKGRDAYTSSMEKLNYITLPIQVAIDGDVRLRHTESAPAERETIFKEFHEHGYEWLTINRWRKSSLIPRFIPTFVKNLIYEIKARI